MYGKDKGVYKLVLPTLESPRELERLSLAELKNLASEIREELCRLYDHRSVHFASNLGVVELCIALHTTFDFSWDRLIWDTGHQIYPHKLLTGRFNQFATIRTKGGLMGFPNPEESEYDLMMTGHAGCSVGTALGLCCGDDLVAGVNKRHSVAVIGDGALSSGVVYEAMNHAGGLKKNLTVVLNDNKMSICPRVGGLSNHLDRLRLHPIYSRTKQKLHHLVDRTPIIGSSVDSFFGRFKNAVKAGLLGGMLFEELGFRYIGPIDGHNIARLQRFLRMARSLEEPVLLHIFTEKGRGFRPAEENPTAYHAPKPRQIFSTSSSVSVSSSAPTISSVANSSTSPLQSSLSASPSQPQFSQVATFTEHVRNAIELLMRSNDRVCVITAAMCQGNMLEPIRDQFPDRFFDVGICESHAVIFAAGLAKSGMLPIVDIYSTFLQRAYDQLFQEISLQNLPIILAIDRAGLSGPDGPTHHGVFDLGYLRPFPNFVVMVPADALDVEPMFRFAEHLECPVAIRYPKADATIIERNPEPIQRGKAEIVRNGVDGMIVACGSLLATAMEAAKTLGKNLDGLGRVDVGVINARFVKPLDADLILQPLRDGKFLVTFEEGMLAGGFGSAVLEEANNAQLDTRRLRRIGIPDHYVEHGERSELLEDLGLSEKSLVKICRDIMFK
ncbi:MAG: 1-deoxy-D-xylulose-5-phosphate synthase [Planctomycetaceae bacterium]|jgi:1-deoxy-D-xylulose-5-phosphate synthase|nr:1-deoxy-D-xylulose-5-phosphate synthase [Planctomycetaceae bacterium]